MLPVDARRGRYHGNRRLRVGLKLVTSVEQNGSVVAVGLKAYARQRAFPGRICATSLELRSSLREVHRPNMQGCGRI
jgi:hypothetical protein